MLDNFGKGSWDTRICDVWPRSLKFLWTIIIMKFILLNELHEEKCSIWGKVHVLVKQEARVTVRRQLLPWVPSTLGSIYPGSLSYGTPLPRLPDINFFSLCSRAKPEVLVAPLWEALCNSLGTPLHTEQQCHLVVLPEALCREDRAPPSLP